MKECKKNDLYVPLIIKTIMEDDDDSSGIDYIMKMLKKQVVVY